MMPNMKVFIIKKRKEKEREAQIGDLWAV